MKLLDDLAGDDTMPTTPTVPNILVVQPLGDQHAATVAPPLDEISEVGMFPSPMIEKSDDWGGA